MSRKDDPETKKLKQELQDLWTKIEEKQKEAADVEFSKEVASVADTPHPRICCRKVLKGHINKVNAVDFSGDSRHLVSGSLDGKLIVWDAWTGNKTQVIPLRSSWVMTAKFAPSGNFVASGGMDNVCTIHDLNNRDSSNGAAKMVRELCGFEGFLSCAKFIDDSNLLTGSADHKVFHWDLNNGRRLSSFDGHDGDVVGLSSSPEGNTFITCSLDKTVKLWDMREGGAKACKRTFRGHTGDINGAVFHPSGLALASSSEDKTCRSFDLRSENQLAVYSPNTPNSGFTSIVFSVSGRYLIAGSDDSSVHIWDFLKICHLGTLQGHDSRVTSVAITPNGVALASCSWDQGVRVWG